MTVRDAASGFTTALLTGAIDYATGRSPIGWPVPVFPCAGKTPRTAHGRNDATLDLESIEAWWWRWPTASIAVPTGTESGLLAVDVDEYKAGAAATWQGLVERHGPLPTTLTARTARGGLHLIFTYPGDDGGPYRPTLGDGVDVKSRGGYIIASPSRFGAGIYRWLNDRPPCDLPPAWLAAIRRPREQHQGRRRERHVRDGEGRVGDDFNARADWMADVLAAHGWAYAHSSAGRHHVTRPGKDAGTSATISPDLEVLYVFSTSAAPLEAERAYDRFGAYTALEHGGDFRAAARALAARGFGERRAS